MEDEARPLLPPQITLEDIKRQHDQALRALETAMNDVEAAQAKRTAWETSHPDWNPTDEEYMALLKSTKILAESCQLFDQLCQNTLLRIKEKEANQRCQDNDLIDTEQLLKPFAKFWEFLASYARTSTSKTKFA
ncbi:unnamed protein product [Aphanomyces euteiches]